MSAETVVDWRLAERTATAVIGGLGPLGRPRANVNAERYSPAAVEVACAEAIEIASDYAGLGAVATPPSPELIGRREWATNALATIAEAARPLERRVAAELELPRPVGGFARSLVGAAGGAEAGLAAGYAARRVLGQYDVALFGPQRSARLLFVAENLDAVRCELGADAGIFLRWIALHEATHVVQFERVGWLVPHLRRLAAELLEGTARSLDAGAIVGVGRRLLGDPRALVRNTIHGELGRLLIDREQRARLDRLQATMAAVEGHAEHVMDAAAASREPGLAPLRRRLDARRARRGGLGELLGRLLGFDLKLRQYELGRAFCDRIVELEGPAALALLWRSPRELPDLAELEHPGRWIERVTEMAAQPA